MKAKEFWKIYNTKYKMYEGSEFSLKTERLIGGDHGCFEVAIYQDNGVWHIEQTKERSNSVYSMSYESEDEAFDELMSIVNIGMRENLRKK